ncbi:MAG: nucleotidyl transferase AbiEii/AbiGii toxin family protein [Pseudomonadota bacterium]|nr:nucleotidyl transferase AbiEii/AbiGii toxin family protein [Pseudomonadota bacterium]MDP1905770.1 nucleotidyl transferase AbiEii/AbiGii toxin family protein [Pseudomonadota bacterium]
MDQVARLPAHQRGELFSETAARLGMTPAVVEKDFWVCWVLERVFREPELGRLLMFKGGTSLSKAYGLIERFSEDVDLILDWRGLCGEDPLAVRSNSQQERLNKSIDEMALATISQTLHGRISAALAPLCQCAVDPGDAHNVQVRYPKTFPDVYLRPDITLEIAPLAAWLPYEPKTIRAYAAQAFPQVFAQPDFSIRVIRAERTFWEKATILHHEAHRPENSPQPAARYSRHYYDLARMAGAPVKDAALADLGLLAEVVAFKQRFYPRGWARYDLAVPGTLRLVPEGAVLRAVESDYRAMGNMIFGEAPTFSDMMVTLERLENDINGRSDE